MLPAGHVASSGGIDTEELKLAENEHCEEASHTQKLWNNSVEGFANDEGDIPASVRAPSLCSGLCWKTAGANQWSLF